MKPAVFEVEQREPTREELDEHFRQVRIHNAKNEIRMINEGIERSKAKIREWEEFIALLESDAGKAVSVGIDKYGILNPRQV